MQLDVYRYYMQPTSLSLIYASSKMGNEGQSALGLGPRHQPRLFLAYQPFHRRYYQNLGKKLKSRLLARHWRDVKHIFHLYG